MKTLNIIEAGRRDYEFTLDLMRRMVEYRRYNELADTLILVEHKPVLTMGRRGEEKDLLVPPEVLDEKGIKVFKIERGGLVTWHGPGQLVMYPVVKLRNFDIGVAEFVHLLEQAILKTLDQFGIDARAIPEHPGVWVGADKIASIGLAVRRGITFHGLALNVAPDLSFFDLINPCGLTDVRMTSIARQLKKDVEMETVRNTVAHHFAGLLKAETIPWSLEELEAILETTQKAEA